MAEKKFSELTSAATLTGSELVAVSQDQSGSLISAKTTTQALSNFTAITAQYSSALQTTNKTICGAINEAAQSGGDTVTVTNTIPATSLTKKVADVNINGTPNAINADDALAVIKDVFGTDHTVEGNPVTFDAWTGIETVKSCSVDLLPIQDLHGYDSPWVGGAGKNKLVYPYYHTTRTNNGVTFTDNGDGTITLNGQAGEGGSIFSLEGDTTIPNGNYILRVNTVGGDSTSMYIRMQINSSDTASNVNVNTDIPITVSGGAIKLLQIRVGAGGQPNGCVVYPFLRLSTDTSTTWTPYSNICPISGRTEVNLTVADAETSPTQTETYTETLGQTVYGGKVDFVSGKLTIDRAFIEFDGSNDENWDISSTGGNPIARIAKPSSITTNIICNSFERVGSSSALSESGKYYIGGSNLVFAWSGTLAEWKTYISATPIQLCWVLATPTTLTLTAEQISLLKGNNVVSTDGDNIKLVYSADIGLYVAGQLNT